MDMDISFSHIKYKYNVNINPKCLSIYLGNTIHHIKNLKEKTTIKKEKQSVKIQRNTFLYNTKYLVTILKHTDF